MIETCQAEEKAWREEVDVFAKTGWLEEIKLVKPFDKENGYGYQLKFTSLRNCAELIFDDPENVTVGLFNDENNNPKLHTVMKDYKGYLYNEIRILILDDSSYIVIEVRKTKQCAPENIYIKNPKAAILIH